jgi:hypothetical protein
MLAGKLIYRQGETNSLRITGYNIESKNYHVDILIVVQIGWENAEE